MHVCEESGLLDEPSMGVIGLLNQHDEAENLVAGQQASSCLEQENAKLTQWAQSQHPRHLGVNLLRKVLFDVVVPLCFPRIFASGKNQAYISATVVPYWGESLKQGQIVETPKVLK